ncbi:unnamed protein product [Thlaspi arvense]|uniref:DYW domain-containing protein n=1 Tax=Thlaspi arvense TaxID=13288 RepID=A0AAU9SQ65_THLAR|nr:unnamed protein product [Thlaspi arvense]
MVEANSRPNKYTYPPLLKACAMLGAIEEGVQIHAHVVKHGLRGDGYIKSAKIQMYTLHGRVLDAQKVLGDGGDSDVVCWNAMVDGKHGDVELGERVGKILLKLEPENSGRYALLSNIYAKAGRWEDVANLRKLMKQTGVKTSTGKSTIDVGGSVHEFKMGDGSHPQMQEIYLMLQKIMEKIRLEGYEPNTSQVLFEIEEEEKETELRYHSEKLAIAFGLLNTAPGMTIRVVKNLRVCEDCHEATKLISKVYNREIIMRDRTRYHHFRNGICSCRDFW